MSGLSIKKWVEPYVLLETLKKSYSMTDLTFDGFSKLNQKEVMLNLIKKSDNKSFGLYMKNVNKFYVFSSDNSVNAEDILSKIGVDKDEAELFDDYNIPVNEVDMARAEAGLIFVD